MDSSVPTAGSVSDADGIGARITHWFLLHGDRWAVTVLVVAGIVLVVGALVWAGILDVGPGGSAATLFASGLASGVVTLVTVALSINQLVLSRVFGSPGGLRDRLEGTHDLRRSVEELAGEPSSPNDPAGFLSLLARTLRDRAAGLGSAIEASAWEPPAEVTTAIGDVADYGDDIDDRLAEGASIVNVLEVVLGTEYARNMTAIHHLRNEYAESIPENVGEEFRAVEDLLEAIAIARQFFKTLSLQQDFARLSRVIVYSGLLALLVTVSLTLLYRSNSVTIPRSTLPVVVSLGIGAIVFPLAAFVAYILRAATIAHRTVSVGPFIPPGGR